METRVRISTPFGSTFQTLPHALSTQPTWQFRGNPTLQLHYPEAGINNALLDSECEVAFEYWNGSSWVEPLDSRYRVIGADRDRLEDVRTRRFDFVGLVPSMLESAYVWESAGLPTDTDGNVLFAAVTPGVIMRTLFLNAQTRGWAPGLGLDFTDSLDSDGNAWTGVINLALDPAQNLYEVISALGSQGIIDWAGDGRTLRIFNPNTYLGRNLPNVRLWSGQGETSAPEQILHSDRATVLRVVGEGGQHWDRSNGSSPWGRLESIMSAGGVTDEGTAYLMSDEELLKASGARVSRTREFDQMSEFLPHRDFRGGDYVNYQTDTGLELMRVFSVSLTIGERLTGHAVLGDRFEDKLIEAARKQQRLIVGKVNGGNGQQPTQPTNDIRTPEAPFGFIGAASVYMDPTGAEVGIISASWSHTGKATDGTAMNLDRFEFRIRDSAPGAPWVSFRSVPGEDRNASFSPVDTRREDGEAALYDLSVRAVGANSRVSGWVRYNELLMELDTTPPPVPSAFTIDQIKYAVATTAWDGLGAGDEPMPPDFSHVIGEVGSSPLGPWQVFGRFEKASSQTIPMDIGYGTFWLRGQSFDRAGNASEWSELTEFDLEPMVNNPDIHDKINELEQGISNSVESANGKNTIHHELFPPNVDGEAEGDTWFQYTFSNRLVGQWRWSGTSWVQQTLSHEIISSVDLGTATVGFLHGSRIEAKTLSVQTLIAGDFTNLAQVDPAWGTNVTLPASCTTEAVDGWTRKAPGGDNILLFLDQAGPVPVQSGDEIYVSFRGMSDVPTTVSCSLWVYPNTDTPFGAVTATQSALSFGAAQEYGFTLTVPNLSGIDGGKSWTVGLTGAGIRTIGVQNVRVYKKTGAVLIKDGSILTPHLGAQIIEAEHIKTNSITGDRMAAGFADFIVMTGSLIQTMSTPMYGIKIDGGTNSMRAWNITNDQTFYLNGDNGDVFIGKGSPFRVYGSSGNLDIGNGRLTVNGTTGHLRIEMGNEGGHAVRFLGDDGRSMQMGADANGGYIGFSVPAFFAAGVLRLEESNNAITLRSPRPNSGDEAGYIRMFPGDAPGNGPAPVFNTNSKMQFTRADSGLEFLNGAIINGQAVMRITAGASIYMAAQGLDASDSVNSDLHMFTDEVGRYVRSYTVYNREYSASSNLYITAAGFIGRTTSKSANKLDQQTMTVTDSILDIEMKTWLDRSETIERGELQALGVRTPSQQALMEHPQRRIPGMIAEEVAEVAPEFVTYGPEGELEGFDRDILALAQIQVLTRRVKALEAMIGKG